MKTNCWEFKKCGREPGGDKVKELGVCKAATETRVNGFNGGTNGGRCCWAVAGTLCGGQVQGTYSSKLLNCMICDHYKMFFKEEKDKDYYKTPADVLRVLNKTF